MIIIKNCKAINCGGGVYIGNGVSAQIDNFEAINCSVGYTFHQDSNVNLQNSKAINNKLGVDIIGSSNEFKTPTHESKPFKLKNKDRNKLCRCGSGKKVKKCHPMGF